MATAGTGLRRQIDKRRRVTGNMANPDQGADAFLQAQLMEETANYLERGRRFSQVHVDQLNKKWIVAFRGLFVDHDTDFRRDIDDLAAELRLRDFEPPYASVKPELDVLHAELVRAGPEAVPPQVAEQIREFRKRRQKPSG